MPRNQDSLHLTDRYREQMLALRRRAVLAARSSWAGVTLDDLDGSVAAWSTLIVAATARAQAAAAQQTGEYVSRFLASELATTPRPIPVDPARYTAIADAGRPLGELLESQSRTVRLALAQGKGAEQALLTGRLRAERIVSTQTAAAGRQAMDDVTQAEDRIVGWRRAPSGSACGACLGAATGAIQADDVVLQVHDFDRCTKEPVVRGVRERARRPTGQETFDALSTDEQDALFHGRGGAEKAELLRSGEKTIADLVTTAPQAQRATQIVETPMTALVP